MLQATAISPAVPVGAPTLGALANVVDIHDFHATWDTHLVLRGISLSIPNGQTVVLTRASDSGKSIPLHAPLATAPITQGSVRLFDVDNQSSRAIPWKRIGYIPQRISPGDPTSASPFEVVTSGLPGHRK